MMTAVVLVLLTLCVCFGIRSYAKKLRQGGGCCCKHSCRMRNPEREVGKSCFFLQIAS